MAQKVEFSAKSKYKFQVGDQTPKINFTPEKKKFDLSIVVVNYNTQELTLKCLDSIRKHTQNLKYEIILVDNASTDGSVEKFKKLSLAKLILNKDNIGFAAANNQGKDQAEGQYVLFLNSDTEISSNLFTDLVSWMDSHPRVGIVGCQLIGIDGKIQESGGYFPDLLSVFSWMTIQDLPFVDKLIKPFHPLKRKSPFANENFFAREQKLDWVIGAFLFIRAEILDQVGGWDKDYFMYTEDVDLCYRVKQKGWEVCYLPNWKILHYGGASSKAREFPLLFEFKGLKRFYRKFYPNWQYPILRLFLKMGAVMRMVLFGILEGSQSAAIYAKAFKEV